MLQILLYSDPERITEYCKKSKRAYSAAHYLYRAENRGEALAAGLFEVGSDYASPVYFECAEEDANLFDGILRAGFNYAAEQGLETGRIPESFRAAHKQFFDRLNYPAQTSFNIVNFFSKYKNCGKA